MKCRLSTNPAPCKQRPPGHIRVHIHGYFYPTAYPLLPSTCTDFGIPQGQNLLCLALMESERHPIRIGRVPVVRIAVVVDIARISRVARPHGRQPPVAPTQSLQRISNICTSLDYFPARPLSDLLQLMIFPTTLLRISVISLIFSSVAPLHSSQISINCC